ncbi:DEAD/DEAH box helicase family protein [Streptomyces sp. NPDC090131]|uniref:DEAD/DEAH box helicase family protein n=1 Tax=Streptomyces sp. NPDC090131 TaxID=3365954 RepID=UPI0037F1D74A
MKIVQQLEREGRPATGEEQAALARWSGWGALKQVFTVRPPDPGPETGREEQRAAGRWLALEPVRKQVRELLSDAEWADARRNLLNAHYTDAGLVDAVWGAVRRLGFDGGRVLEPGSGSGNFIGLVPQDTAVPVRMTGVEVESNTAALAQHLYPDAEIITAPFEDVTLADGAFDAVVGNVPYGRYSRYDKVHNTDLALSIHDHFVLKALAATRPGGVVALITSRFTLDGKDTAPRDRLYELGDLVGAVRLPNGAHREAAGTDVLTDVLFLRRRMPGEERGPDRWLQTRELVLDGHEEPVRVNPYFLDNPEHVLGELRTRLGQYGPEPTVVGDRDAAAGLAAAAESIADRARAAGLTATPSTTRPPSADREAVTLTQAIAEGALGLDDAGNPTIVEDGRIVALEVHPEQRDRLVQLISLKARALALYKAESATTEPGETPELSELRTGLREDYQAYRRKSPPLAKPGQFRIFTPKEAKERAALLGLAKVPDEWKERTAYGLIDDDPDADVLFGLEEWDERSASGVEQAVLHTRVLEPRSLPTTADTPEDAFTLALEWDGGRLDMVRVASLLGVTEDEAAVQISHLAFRDPAQAGFWEPRHRYLSGNVREKLEQAREAAANDPSYIGNVAALEQVQPEDLTPAEIKAKCGAPWIPVQDYTDFMRHLGFEHAEVRHAGGTTWEVRGAHVGDLARSEWGTTERSAQDLMLSILRQADSTIQVTYKDDDGKIHVNQVATDAAREKARLIVQAFDDWIWADPERAERLAGLYNRTFNSLVLPQYDNTPLTLPGMSSMWQRRLREHQNAAVRRILSEPTALLAHVVGAGKTATMVAGAMELRRTGLARKPMLVVPNHMLKQVTREFREIYPDRERVKLLAISARDLNKKRRAKFLARIAGGDWDAVICTHEAFNIAPLRRDTQQAYLDREMTSLREQLDAAREAGMHEKTVFEIETSLANAEARLQKQIDESADGVGMCLEDTGIDYLMVDEAHQYKNLRTISAIPGAGIQGSGKATKLHMMLGYLREANGHNRVATLATGTPIANSVTEAYVLKRYMAPDLLEHMGLENFDSWAATFGEVVSALEPDAKGDGYKYKARFARFFNVPELMRAYRAFADVQMAEDLRLPVPPVLAGPDGQRGEAVHFPVTGAQRQFIKALPHQPWVRRPGGVLKALGLGLRASLDMRLVGGEEDQGSKLEYAAEQITQIWAQTKDVVYPTSKTDPTPQQVPGGLQLVFCDEGTPGSGAEHPVDLYDSLREHLITAGIPREQIRFIHEASTDKKKERLFADCRAGRVAVLVGSTEKMGTGTNIQDRAVALHHLSYPWRPADMAQRDGRIERQGNLNDPTVPDTPDHVRICYYVTSGSFDEFRLNALARKARFISQIQRRDFNLREIEDIGEEALNLGMLSALASGDPAILQLAEATAERARMQGLARTWDRQQEGRLRLAKDLDDYLQRAVPCLEGMRAAMPHRLPTSGDAFAITIDGRTLRSRDSAAATLGARMVALARDPGLTPGLRIPVGSLGGQDFHAEISYDIGGRRQLKLRFDWGHVVPVGHRDDRAQWQCSAVTETNGRGAIVSLENFLNKLPDDAEKLEREIHSQQGHRADAAANFRSADENPYRIAARSKEMEERLLSKLVIVNEKKATLEEAAGANAQGEDAEKIAALGEEADRLRALIADEHAIQKQATEANAQEGPATTQGPAAAPKQEATGRAGSTAPDASTPSAGEQGPKPAPETTGTPGNKPPTAAATPDPDPQFAPGPADPGAPEEDLWESAVRELTAGGLLDERVTGWARANDVENFAIPLATWADSHLGDRWEDLDTEDWPEWVTLYFQGSTETRKAVVARVAEVVHAAVHQPGAEPEPAPETTLEPPEQGRETNPDGTPPGVGEASPGEGLGSAQVDPEVEAVRRAWLQSQDWWVRAAAEGRSGQRLHLASTPGYVLVERTSKVAEGWEVVPASGQRLKIGAYTGIASWDSTTERDHAEAFASRLDQALRAEDGSPFIWPPPRKWRSAEGYRLDRAIAEVRAACDRERGIDSSPGIHQASALADRDAEAHAAAEEKKAAAAAKRAERKAAKAPTGQPPSPDPTTATPDPNAGPDAPDAPAPPQAEPSPTAPAASTEQAESDAEQSGEPEADDLAARLEAGEELIVITPDGPGRLMTLNGDLALVATETAGTRVWHRSELHRPGQPDAPLVDPADLAKRRQNEADAAKASTPAGIVLRYPYYRRLCDLDEEAGHGTIVEGMTSDWDGTVHNPGEVVGWVRARIGDNGKRYWWGQDAAGGPPDDMPFHENLPAKSGLPAVRAAGQIRTDRKPSSMSGHTHVVTPPYAVREIRLTTAQVALLRTLPLTGTYPDGSELPTPPWVGEHRRYVMSVAQMQALRQAAEAAVDTCDLTTVEGRRSRKVLLNAIDTLHFEEYETGRRGASIPPIGEPDPYAGPYTPPPPRSEPDPVERTSSPAQQREVAPEQERKATSIVQPNAKPAEPPLQQTPNTPADGADTGEQDELPGMADAHRRRREGEPETDGDAPAPSAQPTTPVPERTPPAGPVPATPQTGADTDTTTPDRRTFAPQDRVFHDAMRYVVESVSPDGTVIRTVSGQDIPASEVVAEADMSPVTTEDLADGWWRYTYEGRSYTATTLPPDLARTHPTAVLNTVIVDADGQLVGRAFGRPHESAIIWAHAHPGVPHPHVAEWLGTTPTPWPDHTPAEIEHITAGPSPAEPDGYAEETGAPEAPAAPAGTTLSDDRPTPTDAPAPKAPAPETEEPVTPGAGPVEAGTDAETRAEDQPSLDPALAPAEDLEEHDMTVTPDTEPVAPDVEDPPEPERYIETTALPVDPEFTLRLYGWDGQPPESGELLYRDAAIASVRVSQGGGWFTRLSAEGLPADVTSLVATPFQAAHEGAIFFSSLTAVPYGEPIPDAQPVGRLSRADVVRAAVRDAASMNRDLITAASARAWPTTYGSNPQLQHLVERLFEMQNALIDTAGARKMAADMEAVEQAATVLRSTLPEDPAAPERQHMGFRLAQLLYDTARLQDHLRAALEATITEREEQAASAERDAAVEPAIAFPDPPEPQPESDLPPDPEMELEEDVPESPPEQYFRTTALDEDARFSLRVSGEVGQDPDYGEVLDGRAEFAVVRYSAAGGWYGQITDPAADFDFTPPVATPEEAAHHSAILYSIGYGVEYGEAPVPAQDTETATRADVVRAEMADLAVRHRDAITGAAARAWPTTHEHDRHLQALTEALEGLAAAPHEALYVNQMEDRLNAVDAAAMDWVSYLPAIPGPERQHMIFPLYYLARDARRLEARLQATAAAVREEREALRQDAGPEAEPTAAPEAEVVQEQQLPRANVVITLPTDPYYRLHLSGPAGQEYDHGELVAGEEGVADVRRTTDGWYGRLGDFDMAPDVTTSSATPEEAAHKAAILASGLTGRPYGAPAEAAQDSALATRGEILRDEMRAVATHHRAEIRAAAFRAWPAGSDEAAVRLDALNRRLDAMTVAVEQRPSAREMTEQIDGAREAASQVFDWLGTLPDNEAIRRNMAFPLAHLLYDSGRLYWRVEATAAAVQAERVEVADQQRSTEAGEPVPTAPDQDQDPGASPSPDPIPAQQIPAVPEPAPDLPVAVGDRPEVEVEAEAEAELATAPSSEDPAESAASPSEVEDVSTTTAPAACGQEAVVSEQPEAGPPSVEEPVPVEPAGEATPDADLPLWAGPDPDDVTAYEPDAADSDLLSDLSVLQEAVATLANGGVPHDFREALYDELTALEQALDGPVTVQPADAAAEENAPGDSLGDDTTGTSPRQDAAAVNRALAAADQHRAALYATPEWQEIQTVRGAVRNLWEAIKRQTGVHFQQLMGDGRVQAWWKKTSIRICERIANLATRAADRLRGQAPEPAACMDQLHEAADHYGRPAVPPRDDESELQKRMRKLGDGLAASQVKVNAARARSTTVRKPPKPRGAPADQPGHLRRTAADPKRGPRQGR